jgi:hypothetical protein
MEEGRKGHTFRADFMKEGKKEGRKEGRKGTKGKGTEEGTEGDGTEGAVIKNGRLRKEGMKF